MKIAFIDTKLNLKSGGGSNQSLDLLASQLTCAGHDVTVITLSPRLNAYPPDLPYSVISEQPILSSLDKKYRFTLLKSLRKHENDFDIFHLWEPWLIPEAAFYRKFGGKKPVVAYLNNYYFCSSGRIDNSCYKKCNFLQQFRHSRDTTVKKIVLSPFHIIEAIYDNWLINELDAYVAISPAVKEIYSYRKISQEKMFIIPPGIDYAQINATISKYQPSNRAGQEYNILYIGRLSYEKGVDICINAVSQLDFPVKLHVVGDGYRKNKLQQLAAELGISNNVIFHGWMPQDKLVDFYLNSDLFIHPALWPEPLGRTVLDAMAYGLPVIASDIGGPPWALNDSGLTFERENVADLVDKIRLLHSDSTLSNKLAEQARERVKLFDCKESVKRYVELYTRVVNGS